MDLSVYLEPELLILVPVLNLIGYWIKNTGKIKSCYIPLLLSITGITMCLFKAISGRMFDNYFEYIFASFTKGVITAAAAVYSNQIYKQIKGGNENDK